VLILDEIDHIAAETNDDPSEFLFRLLCGEGTLERDIQLSAWLLSNEHCIAATRNANYYELAPVHPDAPNTTPPVYADGYADDLNTVEANALGRRTYE